MLNVAPGWAAGGVNETPYAAKRYKPAFSKNDAKPVTTMIVSNMSRSAAVHAL